MRAKMEQAGEQLVVRCHLRWLDPLLREAAADAWSPAGDGPADIALEVSADGTAFDVLGWEPLTRGVHARDDDVVVENACGSGFDLLFHVTSERLTIRAHWRPPYRERLAGLVLRSRFHLLARAALLQYPALWWAGCRGRIPLHASAVSVGQFVPLLVGPGGVGRSTLLLGAVAQGGQACSDNLTVSDGCRVYGVVEPVRVEGGDGRTMPHGRRERQLPSRVGSLQPDLIVVVRRGGQRLPVVRPLDPERAAAVLTAGTYMAGELRRYWSLAAALALASGRGPVHPPVREVAEALAARLPAVEITLGALPTVGLREMLESDDDARGAVHGLRNEVP